MTLNLQLSEEEANALQVKAAAAGLTLEAWIEKLAEPQAPSERPLQTAAEIVLSHMRKLPPELTAALPTDGAGQHDHYIYGWPKRDV